MKLDPDQIQTGSASYAPEDNKIRLYVGRVPRPEFDALRAEGWTCTPKQSSDFVAIWTPERRDTALAYGNGVIEDEDQPMAERAADRAERFGGYRDKRTNEATGHADRYDSGPQAHGYQNQARAERAAARHDRIADRSCDAWSKAEYWQRRTAGVISHALYKSTPGVRMGRIKVLEASLRQYGESAGEWATHYRLRLAYENQMLEAQGGRLEQCEILAGGKLGGMLILKVNKSQATGRPTSVSLLRKEKLTGWTYKGSNIPGTEWSEHQMDTERLSPDAYTAPTPESLEELASVKKAIKSAAPKGEPCPLINPTDEDAQKLQDLWNERAKTEHCESHLRRYGKDYAEEFKPSTVCRITQAVYSANSKGSYAPAKTRDIGRDARLQETHYNAKRIEAVCSLRTTGADGFDYGPKRVIIITDKPQRSLPVSVWAKAQPEMVAA